MRGHPKTVGVRLRDRDGEWKGLYPKSQPVANPKFSRRASNSRLDRAWRERDQSEVAHE